MGRNADAQILVELGPQSETQPLGDAGSGFSKRESRRTSDSRRQLTAGRPVNNNARRQKTADTKTSAFEIENKTARVQEVYSKTADELLNTTTATTDIEKEDKTEPTTIKNKKKRKRPQKKAKPVEELTEDRSSLTNNEIVTNDAQKRPQVFLNNFMSWLNRFNQQRNVT